ncbi:nuclear pore complex component-domain-containing protein [Scheffersomyces coipomensis]|uniref:nuclear pore complex component-domain-containing protein n=1 Tax=Scheffersomyces coipomensis TaxID=1788519 RepID=UPI00315CC78C
MVVANPLANITQDNNSTVFEDAVNYSFVLPNNKPGSSQSTNSTSTYNQPLKKLPTNSLSDVQYKRTIPRDNLYDVLHKEIPTANTINPTIVQGMDKNGLDDVTDDAVLRLYRSRLGFQKDKRLESSLNATNSVSKSKSKSEPIYYKPPSSNFKDNQYGIKSFLPPNVQLRGNSEDEETNKKNKIPLIFSKAMLKSNSNSNTTPNVSQLWKSIQQDSKLQNKNVDEDELDDNDVFNSNRSATGEWMNPIVKQALARQINKEYELKKCMKFILAIIAFALIKSLVLRMYILFQLKQIKLKVEYKLHSARILAINDNVYIILFSRLIIGIFFINILISLINLFRDQDQCYDLPLSDEQRALIGLKVKNDDSKLEIEREVEGLTEQDISGEQEDLKAELILQQRQYELKHNNNQQINNIINLPRYNKLNGYNDDYFTSSIENEPITLDKSLPITTTSTNSNINLNATATTATTPNTQSIYPIRSMLAAIDNTSLSNTKIANSQVLTNRKLSFVTTVTHPKHNEEEIRAELSKFKKNFNLEFNFNEDT